MNPVAITGLALAASATHVLTGPDHMAAVLPLAVEHRGRAAAVGAWWGLGHGLGVVAVGALARTLLGQAQIASLSSLSEVLVGVLLIALGARAVWASDWGRRAHAHARDHAAGRPHRHDHPARRPRLGPAHLGAVRVDASGGDRHDVRTRAALAPGQADAHDHTHPHDHAHEHAHAPGRPHDRAAPHRHRYGALGFGVLHGAAGGGHLLGVLPSLALPTAGAALYLSVYLGGAVLTMSAFALVCGRLVPAPAVPRVLCGAGLLAVSVGLFWIATALVAA